MIKNKHDLVTILFVILIFGILKCYLIYLKLYNACVFKNFEKKIINEEFINIFSISILSINFTIVQNNLSIPFYKKKKSQDFYH